MASGTCLLAFMPGTVYLLYMCKCGHFIHGYLIFFFFLVVGLHYV